MTDTSKEALRLLNERMCAKVNDGDTIFAEDVADMLDTIKALSAENDLLKARVADLESILTPVLMQVNYAALGGHEIGDDMVILSFMGGGGSATTTIGQMRKAFPTLGHVIEDKDTSDE